MIEIPKTSQNKNEINALEAEKMINKERLFHTIAKAKEIGEKNRVKKEIEESIPEIEKQIKGKIEDKIKGNDPVKRNTQYQHSSNLNQKNNQPNPQPNPQLDPELDPQLDPQLNEQLDQQESTINNQKQINRFNPQVEPKNNRAMTGKKKGRNGGKKKKSNAIKWLMGGAFGSGMAGGTWFIFS